MTIIDVFRSINLSMNIYLGGELMRKARERRWAKWLQTVEFCDACGQVCTPGCRAAEARTAAVDRGFAAGLLW